MSSTALSRESSLLRAALVFVPGGVLALTSVTVTGVLVPALSAEFAAGRELVPWATTAYLLTSAVAIPVGSWAGARFGIRRTWAVALALFAVGAVASALAPSASVLVAARVLQGAGGGALEPLMLAALAQAAGPARMGRTMGAVSAAMALGPLAGPPLGALAVAAAGWRAVFLGLAVLAVAVLVLSLLVLPETAPGDAPLDGVGLALLALATAGLVLGLSEARGGAAGALAVIPLALGAGALVLFLRRSAGRGDAALLPPELFRRRGFGPALAIMVALGVAIYPLFFAIPQYLASAAGLSSVGAGAALVPYAIGTLIAMPALGVVSDRLPAGPIVVAGAVVAAAGLVLLAVAPGLALAALLLVGLGLGAVGSPTVATLYRVLPSALIAPGSTALFVGNQLGGALGVAVVAALIGADGWTAADGAWPLLLPAVALALIAALALRLPAPRPAIG